MRMAYYFEPSTGSRGDAWSLPGTVLKIVKDVNVLDMEMRTEPLLWLIRENRARFGIEPTGIIAAPTEGAFNHLCKVFESDLHRARPTIQLTVKDVSDGKLGWGLGW